MDTFLLAVLEKSPRKNVQADACVALGRRLLARVRQIENIKTDLDSLKQYTRLYGQEYVDALQKDDVGKLNAEAEKYFRRFIDQYLTDVTPQRLVRLSISMDLYKDSSASKVTEGLLRSLLEKDARAEVQGSARLFLAIVLRRRAEALSEAEAQVAAKLLKESEDLLERAATKYPDVELEFNGIVYSTVGKKTGTELFAVRNGSVGKVAPDIEALDQGGKKFKLSDYRGKVVLLDFWSQF